MIETACFSCGAPHSMRESRVPPQGLKVRCPCGASFKISPDGRTSEHGRNEAASAAALLPPAHVEELELEEMDEDFQLELGSVPPSKVPSGGGPPDLPAPVKEAALPGRPSLRPALHPAPHPAPRPAPPPDDLPGLPHGGDLPGRTGGDLPGRTGGDLPGRTGGDLPGRTGGDLPRPQGRWRGEGGLPGRVEVVAEVPNVVKRKAKLRLQPRNASEFQLDDEMTVDAHGLPFPSPAEADSSPAEADSSPAEASLGDDAANFELPSIDSNPPESSSAEAAWGGLGDDDVTAAAVVPNVYLQQHSAAHSAENLPGLESAPPGFGVLQLDMPSELSPPASRAAAQVASAAAKQASASDATSVSAAPSAPTTGSSLELETEAGKQSNVSSAPAQASAARAVDVAAVTSQTGPTKAQPKYLVPLSLTAAVVFLVLGGGALLSQTAHGLFGIYYVERFLPSAGGADRLPALFQQTEQLASSDTFGDMRQALKLLAKERERNGLNRKLLSYSLLQEAMFQLRFGTSPRSEARATGILERLKRRHYDAPQVALGRAAFALSQDNISEAKQLLVQAQAAHDDQGYLDLLSGELALKEQQPERAVRFFAAATQSGRLGARALWGLARARTQAATHVEDSRRAVEAVLDHSPTHAAALVAHAQSLRQQQDAAGAIKVARRAAGEESVAGNYVRASNEDRASAWTLLAQLYESSKAWGKATKSYEQALAADPDRGWALVGAGRSLLREHRYKEALARFFAVTERKAVAGKASVGPMFAAQLGAARAMSELGQKQQAAQLLAKLAKQEPDDWEIQIELGRAMLATGNSEVAEQHLRRAVQLAPGEFAGYLALAELYLQAEQKGRIPGLFREAHKRVEFGSDAYRQRAQFELSRGEESAAITYFRKALEESPRDTSALFGLAHALRRRGDYQKAEETFTELEALDPHYPRLAVEHGLVYVALGQADRAAQAFKEALEERQDDAQLRLRYASALFAKGAYDQAEVELGKLAKTLPSSAEASYFRGRIVLERGNAGEAEKHLGRAAALDATRPEFLAYHAMALLERGSLGRALSEARKALALSADDPVAHWVQGKVQLRSGAARDALASFERALKLKPEMLGIYADLGAAYDQLRKVDEASSAYKRALTYDSSRGDWWYKQGQLLLDLGKAKEAKRAFLRATELTEDAGTSSWAANAHRALGDMLAKSGQRKAALTHYQRYLTLVPTGSESQRIRSVVSNLGGTT